MFTMQMKIFSMITNASVLTELVFLGSPKHIGSVTLLPMGTPFNSNTDKRNIFENTF